MRRSLPPVLSSTLCLLLTAGSVRAEAPRHAVPATRPVQLDGKVVSGEWDDALVLTLGEAGSELRLQQFRGTLMLALSSDRIWAAGGMFTVWLCPDGPDAGASGPGCVRIDYEPFEHNREHAIVNRREASGWKRLRGQVVVRHGIRPGRTELEMAMPLTALGMEAQKRPALRLCVLWARAGSGSRSWPTNLSMRAPAGRVPADLATAARWGLLEGWGDPTGRGAFSATDWKAWMEHDARIAAAGAAAHHAVNLLVEEWKKTKKRDVELVPQVLDNLRSIREHEHLTGNDLLAMTTALRYLNRHLEALGMLEALVDHPDEGIARRALRERALLFGSMQRFQDASADWLRLAELTGSPWDAHYRRASDEAMVKAQGWARERALRERAEAESGNPRVRLRTNRGDIEILLHAQDVPQAAEHFLGLVASSFYDKTRFHRVHGDYLAQGGDPISRDQGVEFAGSGTSPKEIPLEISDEHDFWRGAVGFARPMREFNGSQFFLMTAPRPDLGEYTCFGHIVRGQDVADRLEYGDTLLEAVVLNRR